MTIDGLKPTKKRQKPLSKREQELQKENERLQAVIMQLTKEGLELKKSSGIGIRIRFTKAAIRDFYMDHQENSQRRITYRMIDKGLVSINPLTVYRYLKSEGLLRRWAEPGTLGPLPALPTEPKQKVGKWIDNITNTGYIHPYTMPLEIWHFGDSPKFWQGNGNRS